MNVFKMRSLPSKGGMCRTMGRCEKYIQKCSR